jgi:hypothetical protein
MNISWLSWANEALQWVVIIRIWVAICGNNKKIAEAFAKLRRGA